MKWIIYKLRIWNQVKLCMILAVMNAIFAIAQRSLKNSVLTSTGFEPVTSRYQCDALTNWAMKPLTLCWELVICKVQCSCEVWINDEMMYEMDHIWTGDMKSVKLWSSQSWTQFLQLRKEAWKIQDRTCDLAIPVRRSNQLSYEATDVGSWSFVGSSVHNCEDHSFTWFHIRSSYMIRFINHFIVDSFLTGTLEPTNDQLPTSVAS